MSTQHDSTSCLVLTLGTCHPLRAKHDTLQTTHLFQNPGSTLTMTLPAPLACLSSSHSVLPLTCSLLMAITWCWWKVPVMPIWMANATINRRTCQACQSIAPSRRSALSPMDPLFLNSTSACPCSIKRCYWSTLQGSTMPLVRSSPAGPCFLAAVPALTLSLWVDVGRSSHYGINSLRVDSSNAITIPIAWSKPVKTRRFGSHWLCLLSYSGR